MIIPTCLEPKLFTAEGILWITFYQCIAISSCNNYTASLEDQRRFYRTRAGDETSQDEHPGKIFTNYDEFVNTPESSLANSKVARLGIPAHLSLP